MTTIPETMRAVRFHEWGDRSVLRVDEIPVPVPTAGRVLVKVHAAGVNPGEGPVRLGIFDDHDPAKLPSGQGTDFAGTVVAVAPDVSAFAEGDEVLGWSWDRNSQAEYVAVPASQLATKPSGLSWEVAGALDVAGTTAWAAVNAVDPKAGETIAVSAAAGGVGGIVTQLLVARGARVLGIASDDNADWLRERGADFVARGEGLADRLREAAPDGIDAFIDTFGDEYVRLAAAMGVAPERIETIIGFRAAQEVGAKTAGSSDTADAGILAEVAGLAADGVVEVPIAATFPLEEVQAAYELVEQRRTRGKVVLIP
jgi:NADPH:quinone reductase-like Zn-dependent oxidoreductase